MPVFARHKLSIVAAVALLAVVATLLVIRTSVPSRQPKPPPATVVLVVARSPGAAAEQLEPSVAEPLDAQLAGTPSLRSLRSVATEGEVKTACSFDAMVDETQAVDAVRARVRLEDLPKDVRLEIVRESGATGELARYQLVADKLALVELRRMHDQQLRTTLERLSGVERIAECGVGEPEVRVSLDPMRLRGLGGTAMQVRSQLERFLSAQDSQEQESAGLRNLVVGQGQGGPVRLSDVAMIRIASAPHACACVDQGKPGLCVSVMGRDNGTKPGATAATVQQEIRQWAASGAGLALHMRVNDAGCAKLELWEVGQVQEQAEAETAQAVADAVKQAAGAEAVSVQVGTPDGAWPELLPASGTVEVCGLEPASVEAMRARVASAIEKAVPWLRAAPAGQPQPSVSEAVIRGADIVELARIGRELRDRVAALDDVRQSLVLGIGQRPGLEVRPDRERASALGVRAQDIAWVVSLAFGGQVLHASLPPQHDPLVVRLDLADVGKDPAQLATLALPAASGAIVPLGEVAEITMRARPDPILREDRQRAVLVRVWGPADAGSGWRDGLVRVAARLRLGVGYSIAWRERDAR